MASLLLSLVAGCGFSVRADGDGGVGGEVTTPPPPDTPPAQFDVAHVDDAGLIGATAGVMWTGTVSIDTTTLITSPVLPTGTAFHVMLQANGPEVAVLEVTTLSSTASVHVTGGRPLIIYATGELEIGGGSIDVSAVTIVPGPGGRVTGTGAGVIGAHAGTFADGGGGGGGFGTAGFAGGNATENTTVGAGGAAGAPYGAAALAVLEGGSPGAPGLPICTGSPQGGGSGGALQLSSAVGLRVMGTIIAAGGGGQGGVTCPGNMSSGAGGGSGGAIYVQAPMLVGSGSLAANGGGGGAGSNWNGGPTGVNGVAGQPGRSDAVAAPGGPAILPDGARGGNGATNIAAEVGGSVTSVYPNGGGGGGGAGRIFLDIPPSVNVTLASSPPFTRR